MFMKTSLEPNGNTSIQAGGSVGVPKRSYVETLELRQLRKEWVQQLHQLGS